jgi:hypothetical protein
MLAILAWLLGSSADAATLCVNPGGTGGCFATIQAAIDASGSGDVVAIAPGTYSENLVATADSRLAIEGAGADSTTVDGSGGSIALLVPEGRTRLAVRDLTLSGAVDFGVRVEDRTRTTLERVVVENNGVGAYLRDKAALSLIDSTIRDNVRDGSAFLAAGLHLEGPRSFAKVLRSTISGNQARYGGIAVQTRSRLQLEASTVSGNTGGDTGGIDFSSDTRGSITDATITANVATGGVGTGGVSLGLRGRVILRATVLAGNSGVVGDCSGGIAISRGFNLVEDGPDCFARGRIDLDLPPGDAMLGALADNGGPTETHLPMPGSPLLGAVTRGCPRYDQRGVVRARPCDVGSVEIP